MPRGDTDALMQKALAAQAKIDARVARLKARKNQEIRKEETRLKILLGAMNLHLLKQGVLKPERITELMEMYLTTDRDRDFFRSAFVRYASPKPKEDE